ncbi:hypothetical protein AB1Y20_000980 [Prymnesium parvum]|uniref:Uncharacterized protein n=1 Tax=Prymnesium parvum TaxID=97485 RepID=A0AB34K6E6_PRYPA
MLNPTASCTCSSPTFYHTAFNYPMFNPTANRICTWNRSTVRHSADFATKSIARPAAALAAPPVQSHPPPSVPPPAPQQPRFFPPTPTAPPLSPDFAVGDPTGALTVEGLGAGGPLLLIAIGVSSALLIIACILAVRKRRHRRTSSDTTVWKVGHPGHVIDPMGNRHPPPPPPPSMRVQPAKDKGRKAPPPGLPPALATRSSVGKLSKRCSSMLLRVASSVGVAAGSTEEKIGLAIHDDAATPMDDHQAAQIGEQHGCFSLQKALSRPEITSSHSPNRDESPTRRTTWTRMSETRSDQRV